MTPYEPPQVKQTHPVRILPAHVALTVCVLLALGGIVVSALGLFRILETTPGMGIPVDAQGNRLPVEGYPQLWFGLALTVIFPALALMFTSYILHRR